MAITLNIAFGEHARVMPLKDGTVKPEGIDLNWINTGSGWIFHRNLFYDEFDVSEMSISSTLLAVDRRQQGRKWDWSGLPIFLSSGGLAWTRLLWVNNSAGINSLCDIKGKRIAVNDYEMTAALWLKIVMKDLCGIEAKDNVWYNGRTKELSRDDALGLDKDPPPGVERQWLEEGQFMDTMLESGQVDAAFIMPPAEIEAIGGTGEGYTRIMERWGGTELEGNARIRQLFPDQGKAVISEYHQKFGHRHQPNHHLVIQNRVLKDNPWVARSLFDAFERSKEIAYQRWRHDRSAVLVFEGEDEREHSEVFGPDPYPMGLRAMGKTIERAVQGSMEQGLVRKQLKLEDIYAPTTLDT
jgi:4,5-dihydroxyphthalate decarboxylase